MISVMIPTWNAGKTIEKLLKCLMSQTRVPDQILVVDSESSDHTLEICRGFSNVEIISIPQSEFDHGKTRDMALRESKGDIVVFMTQDAIPADASFIQNLVDFLQSDPKLAVVSGRQIAREDATEMERLIREFNYPAVSNIREKKDIPVFGIKTYYCTDVCAAYRRDIYLELGGFDYPVRTNEDMFFAAKAVQAGYKVGYAADAVVVHSHNFTLRQQYERNFIQGYEIEKHAALLGDVDAGGEGMRMVKAVSAKLLKQMHVFAFIRFGFDCVARMRGHRNGKKQYQREASN